MRRQEGNSIKHYVFVEHDFEPVADENSRVLILGTFPSVKSRETRFYYGHPQNRFWKMLSMITGSDIPQSVEEKKRLLLQNGIAVWDVIKNCEITGSSDSSIRNVTANDIQGLLFHTEIQTIVANGTKAYDLYMKHVFPVTGKEIIKMPSTSPANAAYSLERLAEEYAKVIIIRKGN